MSQQTTVSFLRLQFCKSSTKRDNHQQIESIEGSKLRSWEFQFLCSIRLSRCLHLCNKCSQRCLWRPTSHQLRNSLLPQGSQSESLWTLGSCQCCWWTLSAQACRFVLSESDQLHSLTGFHTGSPQSSKWWRTEEGSPCRNSFAITLCRWWCNHMLYYQTWWSSHHLPQWKESSECGWLECRHSKFDQELSGMWSQSLDSSWV